MTAATKLTIRIALTLAVCGLLVAAAVNGWWRGTEGSNPDSPSPTASLPPPNKINADPAEVFQKAFWKRPSDQDRILHAERREWLDEAGISKWQWFVVVQPSAELKKHLIEDNAFSLQAVASLETVPGSPAWFEIEKAQFKKLQSLGGDMQLALDNTTEVLYATAQGGGFKAGAPPAQPVVPAAPSGGRLPPTLPPTSTSP